MYFVYVDESGDTGLTGSPARYFGLSGLVVHELAWTQTLDAIVLFRKTLRTQYGLRLHEEIHAGNFMHRPGGLQRIPKSLRLRLLRDVLVFEASLPDISIINIMVDKQSKPATYDVFSSAWTAIIQRFHNTLSRKNFPGPSNPQDYGMIIVDQTKEKPLRLLTRRMRVYNPIPKKYGGGYIHNPLQNLVEDPVHRDSLHSYFVQLSDVNVYFLLQKKCPCQYVRKKGARNYFDKLNPVLCRVASLTDPQGIVWL